MELILISASKLKIMLSDADMEKYELNAQTVDLSDTAAKRAFRNILNDVKSRTGFGTEGERIFIQLYPSKDGGCEMFVTKMGMADENCMGVAVSPQSLLSGCRARVGEGGTKERARAYAFETMPPLLAACRRLSSIRWRGRSEAYSGDNGKWYLLLSDNYGERGGLDRLSFISEYGKPENFEHIRLYIREHATCLCDHRAVQTLGVL